MLKLNAKLLRFFKKIAGISVLFIILTICIARAILKLIPSFLAKRRSPKARQKFFNKIIQNVKNLEKVDIALVFNAGGWGYTSLDYDPSWRQILENIKTELENRGYKAAIIEARRRESFFEIANAHKLSDSTRKIASEINKLRKKYPGVKIILAGKSSGASFVEKLLENINKDNVLAIEAGLPFWAKKRPAAPAKTLIFKSRKPDTLVRGDLLEILVSNFPPRIFIGKGGHFGVWKIRVKFEAPNHDIYFWDGQMARTVKNFLNPHFPKK